MSGGMNELDPLQNKFKVTDNLFSLIPSEGPVNFSSQQWRALYLAKNLEIECNQKILVVGASISGATFALALKQRIEREGLSKISIDVIEAQDKPFEHLASAAHRHSHPTINSWPFHLDTHPFSSTTAFPLLNWYADNVESIVEQMRSDPAMEAFNPQEIHNFSDQCTLNLHNNTKLARLTQDASKKWCPTVNVDGRLDNENLSVPNQYNIVILASGFLLEKSTVLSMAGQYWDADNIKNVRSGHQHYGGKEIRVYGTGDGALIDFARLASQQGNIPDNQEVNLALCFIAYCRLNKGRKLEPPTLADTKSESPEPTLEDEIFKKSGDINSAVELVTNKIDTGNPIKSFFDSYIIKNTSRLEKLILCGKAETPYSETAAFANQLLFALINWKKNTPNYEKKPFDLPKELNIADYTEKLHYIRIGQNLNNKKNYDITDSNGNRIVDGKVAKGNINDVILSEDELFNTFAAFDVQKHMALIKGYMARYFPECHVTLDLVEAPPEETGDGSPKKPSDCKVSIHLKGEAANEDMQEVGKSLGGFDTVLFGSPIEYTENFITPLDIHRALLETAA